ncbi:hypothetical protein CO655_33040 [Rhizobium sp. M1]|nr:hypothetical protein CO655_33040 [Rhizobium sp. M1]
MCLPRLHRRCRSIHSTCSTTCKLNAVDPLAYLTVTLTAIVNGHKQSQIDGLLPWSYPAG